MWWQISLAIFLGVTLIIALGALGAEESKGAKAATLLSITRAGRRAKLMYPLPDLEEQEKSIEECDRLIEKYEKKA